MYYIVDFFFFIIFPEIYALSLEKNRFILFVVLKINQLFNNHEQNNLKKLVFCLKLEHAGIHLNL